MPPSVTAVSCDPPASTGPSSWAAYGPRLAMSQRAALTPPTGPRWRQEHLNPVKGFALLPPTPLLALPLFSTSVLERSHQVVIMPAGIIKGKSKLGWGVQKSEMMTLAKKFPFCSWHWWLVTSNVFCHLALCWLSCFWNVAYRLWQVQVAFQAQEVLLAYLSKTKPYSLKWPVFSLFHFYGFWN